MMEVYGINEEIDSINKENMSTSQQLLTAQTKQMEVTYDLKMIEKDLLKMQQALTEIEKYEEYRQELGIGFDKTGKSIAKLEVRIISALDLPRMDMLSGKADTYVTLTVDPSTICPNFKEERTETKWKTLTPVWNQDFCFTEIQSRNGRLILRVMDKENFGDDELIGETIIPLSDLLSQQELIGWYPLTRRQFKQSQTMITTGKVHIGIRFTFSKILPLQHTVETLRHRKLESENTIEILNETILKLEIKLSNERKTQKLPPFQESLNWTLWERISQYLFGEDLIVNIREKEEKKEKQKKKKNLPARAYSETIEEKMQQRKEFNPDTDVLVQEEDLELCILS